MLCIVLNMVLNISAPDTFKLLTHPIHRVKIQMHVNFPDSLND
jgi:hypothetical protein